MKTKQLLAALVVALVSTASALAHGEVELGPNGGRLVEFGESNPIHAEFVVKDGNFVIGLYDEEARKEIPVADQELTVIERSSGTKLTIEKKDGKWSLPKPAGKDFWLVLQLRDKPGAKAKNARLHYDETICPECSAQEWICKCTEMNKPKK